MFHDFVPDQKSIQPQVCEESARQKFSNVKLVQGKITRYPCSKYALRRFCENNELNAFISFQLSCSHLQRTADLWWVWHVFNIMHLWRHVLATPCAFRFSFLKVGWLRMHCSVLEVSWCLVCADIWQRWMPCWIFHPEFCSSPGQVLHSSPFIFLHICKLFLKHQAVRLQFKHKKVVSNLSVRKKRKLHIWHIVMIENDTLLWLTFSWIFFSSFAVRFQTFELQGTCKLLASCTPPPAASAKNLALHKPVYQSSVVKAHKPQLAVDGDVAAWSRCASTHGPGPHWFVLDLQGVFRIHRVRLWNPTFSFLNSSRE